MPTETIPILDFGRGPQLATSRLTVLDVFYYLHRGHDFEFIHRAMPNLSRAEYDSVVEYVKQHQAELAMADRLIEERNQRGIAAQKAQGLSSEIDHSVSVDERAKRLLAKARQRLNDHAEKNGGYVAR